MSLPIAIVGGGPAGAAAACRLAAAGRPVTLFERATGPRDVVCGDFLSVEAGRALAMLGLDLPALGARPIGHVLLTAGERTVRHPLPFLGHSLSRRALDDALLRHAITHGADVRRGVAVRRVEFGGAIRLSLPESEAAAAAVLLATGKHDLRGTERRVGRRGVGMVGFKTYLRLVPAEAAALDGAVEIAFFKDGYAGLQPAEGGRATLCLVATTERLRANGGWAGLRASLCQESPHLARRLLGAEELPPKPWSIAGVPYGFLHRPRRRDPPNLWRLGDQAGVIPSFCGDGIAIALRSGNLAAACLLAARDAEFYHGALSREIAPPIRLASAMGAAMRSFGPGAALAMARLCPGLVPAMARATRLREKDWNLA